MFDRQSWRFWLQPRPSLGSSQALLLLLGSLGTAPREGFARAVFRGGLRKKSSKPSAANRRTFVMTNTELQRIKIFDTTLRDGEQSPGAAMTHERNCDRRTARRNGRRYHRSGLSDFLARRLQGGERDRQAVKRAGVCGLSRAGFKDIDRAGEALKGAVRPRIHTFISTSPVHMKTSSIWAKMPCWKRSALR